MQLVRPIWQSLNVIPVCESTKQGIQQIFSPHDDEIKRQLPGVAVDFKP